jgi:hypothetical protein
LLISLVGFQPTIKRHLAEHNWRPRSFVWTADPNSIVERLRCGYHASASVSQPTADRRRVT